MTISGLIKHSFSIHYLIIAANRTWLKAASV
jgi:hypothetical protein